MGIESSEFLPDASFTLPNSDRILLNDDERYEEMHLSKTIKLVILYSLITASVILFISYFSSYYYLRSNSPKIPDATTGHVYPERMKQPYDVYLTKHQILWLQYGIYIPWIPFIVGFVLNDRWKLVSPYNSLNPTKR